MKQKSLLKTMLLLFALIAGSSSVWAENNVSTVSTAFSANGDVTEKFTQTGNFTSVSWNLAVTWGGTVSWQSMQSKGCQIGSGGKPATSIVLTGSGISGTITSVVVNTSVASGGATTVAVSVGGTEFKNNGNSTANLATAATDFDFTGSATGNIVITWSQPTSTKAIYIKSITTTYTTGEVVKTPVFSPAGGTYTSAQSVSISCETAGSSIYYTTDGSTPTTSSTAYTGAIAVSSTTNIKAIATKAGMNNSAVASAVYTIVESAKLPFNWAGGSSSDLNSTTGVTSEGLGSDYGNTHDPYNVKLDNTDDYIQIVTNGRPGKVTIGVKMIGGSTTSKITVKGSADGTVFNDVEVLTISGSQNDIITLSTTKAFASTDRIVKLVFTKGSNVGVGPINIAAYADIPVTISSATWASFSSDMALDFTGTGVTAYIAKSNGGTSSVTLTEIEKVPANTGIVVNGSAATHNIPVLTGDADATTGNLLKPWLTAGTPGDATYYTLAAGPTFKKSSGGTLAAGKAYLVMPGAGAPELGVDFGGTTGINAVNGEEFKVNGEYYNLAGQRVAQPTKGLYIVNGKKVIIK